MKKILRSGHSMVAKQCRDRSLSGLMAPTPEGIIQALEER